jgi:hypothetical protein
MSTPRDDITPGPVPIPNEQSSAHVPPGLYATQGFSDRDNFVTDMVTLLDPAYAWTAPAPAPAEVPPVPVTPSAGQRKPVLSLSQIKLWLRIEASQTDEDSQLTMMEMAARLHTEQYTRQKLDPDATDAGGIVLGIGENIQMAMLLLIAQWYRNRELMVSGRLAIMPQGYAELLATVREYPVY